MTRTSSQAAVVWWLALGPLACSDSGTSHASSAAATDSAGVQMDLPRFHGRLGFGVDGV